MASQLKPVPDDVRAVICRLRSERHMDPEDIAASPQVDRPYRVVVWVLVQAGLIRPGRPNVRDEVMREIAGDYKNGDSIRGLARKYGRSYGGTRRVLEYMGVPLRSRGGGYHETQARS